MNLILSGSFTASAFNPDLLILPLLEPGTRILDFGCGIGRNTFGLAEKKPHWTFVGFDCAQMIARSPELKSARYSSVDLANASFVSDESELAKRRFDAVFSVLVFQHMSPKDISSSITLFRLITERLIIGGRRANDFGGSTWGHIEACGITPEKYMRSGDCSEIAYHRNGQENEHTTAIYAL